MKDRWGIEREREGGFDASACARPEVTVEKLHAIAMLFSPYPRAPLHS
jgi:hypothetical protein